MAVRFILKDIPEDQQKKIDNLLTFDPETPNFKKYDHSFSFIPSSNIEEKRVKMYFSKEGIVHLPFWFAAVYYKKYFNQDKKYQKIFEDQNGKFAGKLLARQIEPFKKAIEHLNKHQTTTIALYPGFGKTFMGVMLSWYYNLKTCVLVHRDNVGKAWLKTFKNYFKETLKTPDNKEVLIPSIKEDDITWVNEKGKYNKDAKIFVVMDTRVKKIDLKILRSFGMLIIDEAHLFCCKSKVEPMLSFTPKYVIAESATIQKSNGMEKVIQSICGPHSIEKISDKPYNFFLIKTDINYEFENSKNIYNDLLNHRLYNQEMNEIIVKIIEKNQHHKSIIVTKFKDHCKIMKEMIENKGIETSELYGSKKNYDPKNVLIGTGSKMGVGFDEANFCDNFDGRPSDLLIITYTFATWEPFEQVRGRGMRSEKPNVLMITDNHNITKKHFRLIKKWIKKTNGNLIEIDIEDIEDFKLEEICKKSNKN